MPKQKRVHQGQQGVSTDPKARAQAARQSRQTTSTSTPALDGPASAPAEEEAEAKPRLPCGRCGRPSTKESNRAARLKKRETGFCKEHLPLPCTVRVGLLKPIGGETWDEVGARLRDLHGSMHRLLNAGVRASAIADGKGKEMLQASRAAVKLAIRGERDYWAGKKGGFEGENHDPGKVERMKDFALPSPIEDTVAKSAAGAFADAKKHMLRGDKSIPSFNHHAPILFRDGDNSWRVRRDAKGRYEVGFKLGTEARGELTWFAASVKGASAWAHMSRMTSGLPGIKVGSAKIVRNRRIKVGPRGEKRPMWEALLVYTRPALERSTASGVVVAHRGVHHMLTMASSNGTVWEVPGDGYLQAKQGFAARRAKLSSHTKRAELGQGARGRGTRRRYASDDGLWDAEARMVKTACQQAAKRLVDFARREEASTIVIEDYQTIHDDGDAARFLPKWPWAELKTAIEWAARAGEADECPEMTRELGAPPLSVDFRAKLSFAVEEVPAAYISMKCPACKCISAQNIRGWVPLTEKQRREEVQRARDAGEQPRTHQVRMFECQNIVCMLRRNVDHVAAWNMLDGYGLGDGPRKKFEESLASFARQCQERKSERSDSGNEEVADKAAE